MNKQSFAWLSEQIVRENSDAIMFADHEGAIRLWTVSYTHLTLPTKRIV